VPLSDGAWPVWPASVVAAPGFTVWGLSPSAKGVRIEAQNGPYLHYFPEFGSLRDHYVKVVD